MSSVKETDTHKLWRNIEPHLKKAMQTIYLREVSRSVLQSLHLSPCMCVSVCVFLTFLSLLSLQWEQMQQTEEECGALRGTVTL